jgi:ribokinase
VFVGAAAVRIVVVGSCNVDLVWRGPRLPTRGETVSGGSFERGFGGKGANQAAAAARLGAAVTFVGCVGDDDLGAAARADLEACGVDCHRLQTHAGVATGTALINVDADGENTIAVAPGANRLLTVADIEAAIAGTDADVLIAGLEIGTDEAAAALRMGRARRMRTIFNPSPIAPAAAATFGECSSVVVNEVEAKEYGGPAAIRASGADEVVVTLGARGAARYGAGGIERVGAFAVPVTDTTGAGDAFCAALAVSDDLDFACAAGALACRAVGARSSQPTRGEVDALLREPTRAPRG